MGSNPVPGPLARKRLDWLRKLAALLLVLASVTGLMIALGLVSSGRWWGAILVPLAAAGILLALKITPEGGTTGYFDQNI